MKDEPQTISVDGTVYRRDQPANGNRAVVVVDRGWIFAGDVEEKNGRIRLTRAVWVFRWERVGFAAVVADPSVDEVDIRPIPEGVDVPAAAEVFRIPVGDDWGL